jgi:hypothetical protein
MESERQRLNRRALLPWVVGGTDVVDSQGTVAAELHHRLFFNVNVVHDGGLSAPTNRFSSSGFDEAGSTGAGWRLDSPVRNCTVMPVIAVDRVAVGKLLGPPNS